MLNKEKVENLTRSMAEYIHTERKKKQKDLTEQETAQLALKYFSEYGEEMMKDFSISDMFELATGNEFAEIIQKVIREVVNN